MTREGGPGSGPQKDSQGSNNDNNNAARSSKPSVLAHFTYGPEYKAGVKYDKPSTYPKAPGRLNKSESDNKEKLLPFSSGQPHISTYPLSKGGSLGMRKKEADSGSNFPQALRGQDEKF